MNPTTPPRLVRKNRHAASAGGKFLLVLSVLVWHGSGAIAQVVPARPPAALAELPVLPALEDDSSLSLPEIRPVRRPEEAASFVDSLRGTDAAFEVIVGQGRILTTKVDITAGRNQALIAAGDPSIIEFAVVSPRQIRVTGLRIGLTDLSITTSDGKTYSYEVRVLADLSMLRATLKATFPDAHLTLGQIRDSVVVEGEARSNAQVGRIIQTIVTFLRSVEIGQARTIRTQQFRGPAGATGGPGAQPGEAVPPPPTPNVPGQPPTNVPGQPPGNPSDTTAQPTSAVTGELSPPLQITGAVVPLQVINLIKVPGSTQVMLKVRVAELNRTAFRLIGSNFLGVDRKSGAIVGSIIGAPSLGIGTITPGGAISNSQTGSVLSNGQATPGRQLVGTVINPTSGLQSTQTTVFGIFQDSNFEFTLEALRKNSMLKILAEPNLVAMSGHSASFLAGGEFPVPVPQVSAGGVSPTVTVRFKEFGVRLGFLPYILDNEVIRLSVAPEVSQIDFTIATTLVAGGTPVPGLNTRKAQTTVEMRQGQTLAIAGLLQLQLDGVTTRIPGLGDLPIIGPFFSNTTGERIEKELVVLVTPYLVEPMNCDQVPPTPGDEVYDPNDLEFYFGARIEGRTGKDFRATTRWDDVFGLVPLLKLERKYVCGPSGFSD
jgi:pilus assembly protein CpaC